MDTILFITDLHVGSQVTELGGVFDRALAHRWRIVEVELTRLVRPISEIVRRWRPAGCILEGSGGPKVNLRRTFRGIPVVHLDPDPETAARAKHTVSGDPATIAAWAAQKLMQTSPASYAYVGWGTPAVWSIRRGQAFEEAVRRETGTKTAVFSERWDIGDTIGLQDSLVKFLLPLKKPVGIFAVNDYTAIQVAEACTKAGWKCPEDFMLVGVDNEEVHCECTVPTVTSIEQDFRGAGRMAADLLAELIANPALPPRHVKYGPVRLVNRQSTRTLKMHDPQIARAVERIRRDANTGLTSADVLAEIPVSRRLAEKRFLAATGHTILQEIQDVRFQKVCELLMGDIPIGHIAERCGLQSDSFLKRFFKARTGQTLREWRKAHRAQRNAFKAVAGVALSP